MKPSNYTFAYPMEDSENPLLIYNTRTNALAVLDSEHIKKYNKFLTTGILDDEKFEKDLLHGGYIFEDNISELEILRMQMLNSRHGGAILSLTIAGTADCNFRCVYCYEKGSIKTSKMSAQTQDAILKFVKDRVNTISGLSITWYGGEPMLAFDIIEYLSSEFMKLCSEYEIPYNASIVTNGYLLSPEKCQILINYQVKRIQVTLDGPQEIHDVRRPLAGGQGTFQKIIANLRECSSYFEVVSIRINTDSENLSTINSVKQTLEENGILKENVHLYLGFVENHNDAYELEKCLKIDQFSHVNLEFVRKNGSSIMALYPRLFNNYCCADYRNAFIVDSEGYLYKCWNDVGMKENNIGHIGCNEENVEYRPNERRFYDFMLFDPTLEKQCSNCKCLPICMGGCPYTRLRNPESEERCINQKFILDEYIKECAITLIHEQKKTQ